MVLGTTYKNGKTFQMSTIHTYEPNEHKMPITNGYKN
jgi:hypothetical protein